MIDPRLTRLLWRYEYGRFAPELLETELRSALDEVRDDSVLGETAAIRLWAPDLIPALGDAVAAASRAIVRGAFRDALRDLGRCDRISTAMHDLSSALAASDRAESVATAVYELAGVRRLRMLPSVASLAQVVDLARQHIVEQQFVRAARIAEVCTRLGESLLVQCDPNAGAAEAAERIEQLEVLCAATQPFMAPPRDDPGADGTFLVLRTLLRGRHVRLGTRLLTELEIQLGSRRKFQLLHQRETPDGGTIFGSIEDIQAVIREVSWDGALDHYWRRAIACHSEALARQSERIGAVTASIDGAIESVPTTAE